MPEAPSRRGAHRVAAIGLTDVLEAGLTRPVLLGGAAEVEQALRWTPGRETECALALASFDVLLYSRPDLVSRTLLDRLLALARAPALPERLAREVVASLGFLANTGLAGHALAGVLEALRRGTLGRRVRQALPGLLRTYARWRLDLLDLEMVMKTAKSPHAVAVRAVLFDHVVEPLLCQMPELVTSTLLAQLRAAFEACPRYLHVLSSLASRPGTTPGVRTQVRRWLVGQLPRRALAQAIPPRRPYALLVVVNARIGQGDEILTVVPLAQALLAANRWSSVTLLTRRTYLYDHPRAEALPIEDGGAAARALASPFDAVLDVFDHHVPDFAFDPGLERALDGRIAARHPRLVLKRDLTRNDFAYRVVAVRGRNMARRWGLDRRRPGSVYETDQRLLAEAGLPDRAGEETLSGSSLLVGTRSPEAEAWWLRLTGRPPTRSQRVDGRPVAVVNPFGGADVLKGYLPRQADRLTDDLEALAHEGYLILLLPHGPAWAGTGLVDSVLARMGTDARRHVATAPDPAVLEPATTGLIVQRPELSYADRVMRLFKYFASYADLIVTVEGWLGHLAYQLGRPFRLVLAPGSHAEWHPNLRSRHQRLVPRLSPLAPDQAGTIDLLGRGDPPPFPFPPRNLVLQAALPALGLAGDDRLVTLLLRALASEDPAIRQAAATGLGEVRPPDAVKGHLIAILRDPSLLVRSTAAEALVRSGADCHAELGLSYRDVLAAHVELGRFDAAILRRGAAALPALLAAAEDQGLWRRQWARAVLARLLASLGVRPASGRPATAAAAPGG